MDLSLLVQDLARGAGEIVRNRYTTQKSWKIKTSRADIVTEVDEAAEDYIIGRLREERPDDAILSEESGWSGVDDGRNVWIIDPIDGTTNYATGIPFFTVSIAVAQGGISKVGAVYDPLHDEMFHAAEGSGAFLNDRQIFVSTEQHADAGLISVSWVRGKSDSDKFVNIIRELSQYTSQFRRFGSAALALSYAACGRLNGFIQSGLSPWDIAAAELILREAGAIVTDFSENSLNMRNPNVEIIAGNPFFHKLLVDALNAS